MPLATIHKMGQGDLYHIHFMDAADPGFGQGRPPTDPGYGQGRPGGRPDHDLPGGRPGIPSNELPETPPPQLAPGYTLVLIRHEGKWAYAAIAPGSPPPRPLPGPPDHIGGRPPGQGMPDLPNQGLPGGPPATGPGGLPPHISGQPVPPVVGGGPMPTPPPTAGQPLPPAPQPR